MASRYLIGVDLGTTNSVAAYLDADAASLAESPINVLPVPQMVAPGETQSLSALPSFLYYPTEEELASGEVIPSWDEEPAMVTGVLARERGALVPTRQVSSAKSWLSFPGAHRRARILPAQAQPSHPRISPVEASARYLMHLRDTWNQTLAGEPALRFEQQEIVLTIPGSFDEEARELTVEATREAKLENVTLLEEPLAAFYAWMAAHPQALSGTSDEVRDGHAILICDIGGGTSDFSLVCARLVDGELQFERIAIGEHLLLGGDNLDLALAHHVENKLAAAKLTLRQRYALRRTCCTAKERLLGDASLTHLPITVLGSGSAVVGQALSTELTRAEILEILSEGFLPLSSPEQMPAASHHAGLRELGLPYASDSAITRHLAAFLRQAAANAESSAQGGLVRPDAVLFNGGFCAPAAARERIVDALSAWFAVEQPGWRPRMLHNEAPESAVARGAAYYARVRRGAGRRIRAGNARSYFVALPSEDALQGICVLPAGVDEGTTLPLLNRDFSVLANRPVSFMLYSSRTQHAAHGEVVALRKDEVHLHPPLVSLLRYGKKMRNAYLNIGLRATFTEVGTLELWCEARSTPHRWRLQFDLREEEAQAERGGAAETPRKPAQRTPAAASDAAVESAAQRIRAAFSAPEGEAPLAPEALIPEMETVLKAKRDAWPVAAIRRFADVLVESSAGRKLSPAHEMRWLSLCGFCLRPGFGAPGDTARAQELRRKAAQLAFADDLQCQIAALVAQRRAAGGIGASDQQALYRSMHLLERTKKRPNRQLHYERWRLAASLEHLIHRTRAALGKELLAMIQNQPEDAIWLWCLGRLGARIPLYGPLHCVVPGEIAGQWIQALLELPAFSPATAAAIASIGRRTNQNARDIDEAIREQTVADLTRHGVGEDFIRPLSQYVAPDRADAVRSFGESLPPGLDLVSSPDCLLSLPAFTSI